MYTSSIFEKWKVKSHMISLTEVEIVIEPAFKTTLKIATIWIQSVCSLLADTDINAVRFGNGCNLQTVHVSWQECGDLICASWWPALITAVLMCIELIEGGYTCRDRWLRHASVCDWVWRIWIEVTNAGWRLARGVQSSTSFSLEGSSRASLSPSRLNATTPVY